MWAVSNEDFLNFWQRPGINSTYFAKSRWYLLLSVGSWAAMIKLSPLAPELLNQAQPASLSTKVVHALVSHSSSIPSFTMPSFSVTLVVFELLTKANIYSLFPLLPSAENILPSRPHAFFFTSLQNLSLQCSIKSLKLTIDHPLLASSFLLLLYL